MEEKTTKKKVSSHQVAKYDYISTYIFIGKEDHGIEDQKSTEHTTTSWALKVTEKDNKARWKWKCMEDVEANQIEEVAGIWKEMLHLLEQN